MKNMSSFKKSVLSIVFMSAVTGSFISWDKYQPRNKTQSLVEFYENRDLINHFAFLETIDYSKNNTVITEEEKRLIEAELMAQSLAENIYAREADDMYLHNNIQEISTTSPAPSMTDITVNEVEHDLSTEALIVKENLNDKLPSKEEISEQVLFAFDSSEVADKYLPLLNKTAHIMQNENADDSKIWQVVGYADLTGNNIYNDKLAYKRAQSVTEYLVNKGVQEDKLIIVSLGESQSKQSLQNEQNKRLARRVEIHEYDDLVASLSEQFKDQVKSEMVNIKKYASSQLKTEQTAHQIVSQESNEVSVNEQQELLASGIDKSITQPKTEHKFEFSQQPKHNMATVMKL
ncbi:OmpA family protein [Psychromonas sp. KJ10-10]|uniref:OmpA family protein n=1 Tax=Psychromonas sp. KJ10-10 TaxID=3391823 RepID=UPI0039B5019A